MRIAFLTPEFVSEKKFDGGLANYIHRTALALKQRGHEPEVFVAADRTEDFDFHGIPVHRVRLFSPLDWRILRIGCRLFHLSWFASWEGYCVARSLSRGLMSRHAENPFDIVQVSDFQATGLLVPKSASFTLITRLSWFAPAYRKAYEKSVTPDTWLKEKMEARSVRRAHFVYAPSTMMATVVGKELGVKADVVHPSAYNEILPADEDASAYEANLKGKRYVLFFGRLCRPKGVIALAEAMSIVLQEAPDVWLALVGREDPVGIMNELRGLLGETASARTVHLQRLPHTQLYPIIRHADFVCLPSRIDNFPNTCIEAMSLGQIVVGTRGTGFEDLIRDGESGLLVNSDDPPQLAATAKHVLQLDPETRERMKSAAAKRVAEFSPEQTIPELLSYYQQCLSKRQTRGNRGS